MMLERGAHSNWAKEARRLENGTNHSCLSIRGRVFRNARAGPTTTPTRASETRCMLRLRNPVECLARDAVLSEKEAQSGRMFLHVAHGQQEEF